MVGDYFDYSEKIIGPVRSFYLFFIILAALNCAGRNKINSTHLISQGRMSSVNFWHIIIKPWKMCTYTIFRKRKI
ncbi:hypothetical protein KFK09_017259 [Dendrobium nobile]|uniref:Uncharacterized protein n=1 Tax=Dendrobium nobile TaxID=94219 RepID=A0A8T3B2Y0_DENNO|nr:hypothetical protein KFK09_017259 [Dendrobium nobile]